MKKAVSLLLTVMLVLLAFASVAEELEAQGRDMYVYTKNGKVLLVRSSMTTDANNVIGSLAYGSKVVIYGVVDGWAVIDYGNTAGYVMYRFLSKTKPAPHQDSGSTPEKTTAKSGRNLSTAAELNALFASAKIVSPYSVYVRPARASGWVYLRWFPSETAKEMTTFNAGYELIVLAEMGDWYQVSDPKSDTVGFICKDYVQ